MKALILKEINGHLQYADTDFPKAKSDELVVKVLAAGLNRRDFYITRGMYPGVVTPAILGSDGCVEHQGKLFIINPNVHWGDHEKVQSDHYHILGLEQAGTLAEYVAVGDDRLHLKPDHLSIEEAATLPLAGLTAFRSLFSNCQLSPMDNVLITGVGGGAAIIGLQMAVAIGAKVYVTSSSEAKIAEAVSLGAMGGVLYTQQDWDKELMKVSGGIDVVMDSVGGEGFAKVLKVCKGGARVGFFGGTAGAWPPLNPGHLFFKQLSIFASTMGNDSEFKAMLDFVNYYKIKPIVGKTFSLQEGNEALAALQRKDIFGKICVRID